MKALASSGSRLYAIFEGDLPFGIYATDDGVRWTAIDTSEDLPRDATALAVDATTFYVGTQRGVFANIAVPRRRAVR